MVLRHWVNRLLRNRALVIGLCGGTVTSLAGIVAYVLVPYLRGDGAGPGWALAEGASQFMAFSPLYHAVVLVVVPFVTTVVAVGVARRRGLSTWVQDLKVVGSIVLVPFTTVVALYFVGALGVGLAMGASGDNFELSERLMGVAGMTGFALIFGLFFMLVVGAVVFVGELLGAGSGYLVARRLSRR